jgi:hypothetical protein
VNGLFGAPYRREEIEGKYADRPLALTNATVSDGLYYYQGAVRQTRRVVNQQTNAYLDLHPGEELLLNLFDGQQTLVNLNTLTSEIQQLPDDARLTVRNGTDLVVQLDELGVLA